MLGCEDYGTSNEVLQLTLLAVVAVNTSSQRGYRPEMVIELRVQRKHSFQTCGPVTASNLQGPEFAASRAVGVLLKNSALKHRYYMAMDSTMQDDPIFSPLLEHQHQDFPCSYEGERYTCDLAGHIIARGRG